MLFQNKSAVGCDKKGQVDSCLFDMMDDSNLTD